MIMEVLPWLFGGGALAAFLWSRQNCARAQRIRDLQPPQLRSNPSTLEGRWVLPIASWNGRTPVISDGFGSPRPEGRTHRGVDMMFLRQASDDLRPGTSNGSAGHVMPDNAVVVAASDGVIWSARQTSRGFAIVIDHGPRKIATFYGHLERIFVTPTTRARSQQRVRAGEPIGIVGFDPRDGQRLKHLHFEFWRGGPNDAVDPRPLMAAWPTISIAPSPGLRNASGFHYRPVGVRGEDYPDWVRALKGKAGVYIIRETGGEIVYVGSSAGQLYDTLTRHFQRWRRWKGFWKGQYAEGHDPGMTYPRSSVEVAIRLTTPNDSLDEEMALIRRLRPRDNLIGQPDDEAPF